MRFLVVGLAAAVVGSVPAFAETGCKTRACEERVAAKQEAAKLRKALADARWCKRDKACSARVAKREARVKAKAAMASLTPYPGPDGTRWAIPWEIVRCESHGVWTAANPSGAIGPYQLLGHGAPWPVDSEADRLEHHRIAAKLWAGGAGRSHWVC